MKASAAEVAGFSRRNPVYAKKLNKRIAKLTAEVVKKSEKLKKATEELEFEAMEGPWSNGMNSPDEHQKRR